MSIVEQLSAAIPVSMDAAWFQLAKLDHFWIQWRFKVLKKHLSLLPPPGCPALEVGCGNGIVMKQFEQLGYTIDGCDLDRSALEMIQPAKGRVMLYNVFDLKTEFIDKYSMLLLMDVIEHIDDDVHFLVTVKKYLHENGLVIINVPAGNMLFSRYDIQVGHKRRYNKKMIRTLFIEAGIQPLAISYWGASLFPIALIRKWVLSFTDESKTVKRGFYPPGKLIHLLLKIMMHVETAMPFHPPFGSSLLAIGKKVKSD